MEKYFKGFYIRNLKEGDPEAYFKSLVARRKLARTYLKKVEEDPDSNKYRRFFDMLQLKYESVEDFEEKK